MIEDHRMSAASHFHRRVAPCLEHSRDDQEHAIETKFLLEKKEQ
jgi:hypothetical protein